MRFEWDPDKNESNFIKHGITFEEASTVFDDEFARIISAGRATKNEVKLHERGRLQ